MKKAITLLLAVVMTVCLAGCKTAQKPQDVGTAYANQKYGFQLENPKTGETIAILHTSKGDISLRFFPEAAPKAVKNFQELAKAGYYDGLTFHRVIEDFMIQGGDPKGDGTGGESYYGEDFEDEFDQKLLNLRGSVAMANAGVNTNGSQFFINQGDEKAFDGRASYKITDDDIKAMKETAKSQYQQLVGFYGEYTVQQYYGTVKEYQDAYVEQSTTVIYDAVPSDVWDLYEKHGGNISLDGAWRKSGGHTVFAQVFSGMDVVDKIAGVSTDSNDKPKEDVLITSVEITTYQGK